jgi:acyl dehydratase
MTTLAPYSVVAFNAAKLSENKMHDDTVAKRFGFTGGLVPGVDVFAYMSHAPIARWGRDFLERGEMAGRFGKPLYEGQTATVTAQEHDGGLDISIESQGIVCGTARATLPAAPAPALRLSDFEEGSPPPAHEQRPPADERSYRPGAWLAIRPFVFDAEQQATYLKDIGERDPLYSEQGLLHDGTLLRACNWVLTHNARMGPWIHVGSKVQHLATGRVGDEISTRARVLRNYENKAHKIVELDVLIVANGTTPIARVEHAAIYEPRQVRAA